MITSAPIELQIDPLAWEILPRIDIGPLAISPHGIGVALGFLLGAQLMVRRARRHGGPDETHLWNMIFYILLGSIIGARVGYLIGHIPEVTDNGDDILGIFRVWEGGISLLGGITGGVLFGAPYVLKHNLGFWRTADLAVPGLALGIVVGRIGDLAIGDHLGKPTEFALGWRCLGEAGGIAPASAEVYRGALQRGEPPSLGCYDLVLHQTAIYDFVATLLLLGLLLYLGRRRLNVGFLTLTYVVWYGTMRVITDFLRVDQRYFGLTGSQLWALVVVLACAFMLTRYRGAPPRWATSGTAPSEGQTTEGEQTAKETRESPAGSDAP